MFGSGSQVPQRNMDSSLGKSQVQTPTVRICQGKPGKKCGKEESDPKKKYCSKCYTDFPKETVPAATNKSVSQPPPVNRNDSNTQSRQINQQDNNQYQQRNDPDVMTRNSISNQNNYNQGQNSNNLG